MASLVTVTLPFLGMPNLAMADSTSQQNGTGSQQNQGVIQSVLPPKSNSAAPNTVSGMAAVGGVLNGTPGQAVPVAGAALATASTPVTDPTGNSGTSAVAGLPLPGPPGLPPGFFPFPKGPGPLFPPPGADVPDLPDLPGGPDIEPPIGWPVVSPFEQLEWQDLVDDAIEDYLEGKPISPPVSPPSTGGGGGSLPPSGGPILVPTPLFWGVVIVGLAIIATEIAMIAYYNYKVSEEDAEYYKTAVEIRMKQLQNGTLDPNSPTPAEQIDQYKEQESGAQDQVHYGYLEVFWDLLTPDSLYTPDYKVPPGERTP